MVDRVGQQFGNYLLIRKLGSGAFADVYLGKHVLIGSDVAIKILHEPLSNENKEPFRAEARNLAQLIHPNIVHLLDFNFENNIPYLVMDYAPNGSLRDAYPAETRLPLNVIIPYVKQVAAALQYAHNQKLIHRDVKPENMLVGRNGEVILSDFGIAVIAHSSKSIRTEDIAGTLFYMAPEQLVGKPHYASDQYALGVIVYQWLTGIFPFTGTIAEIISQTQTSDPPLLRNIVPDLSIDVEYIVLKALEKKPERRFETIQVFAQALEQASLERNVDSTFFEGKYQEAIRVYSNVIQHSPRNAEAFLKRANAYFQLGQNSRAKDDYNRAIKFRPRYVEAFRSRAAFYYKTREYQLAINDYTDVIDLEPSNAADYSARGDVYKITRQYHKAMADYDEVVRRNPQDAYAVKSRGCIYYNWERYERAKEEFDWAIQLNNQDAGSFIKRGDTFRALKRYAKAVEDYEQAMVLDPQIVEAYRNCGVAFYKMENYLKAIEYFSWAIQLEPWNAVNYRYRGSAYQGVHEYQKVIEDYNRAIELDPRDTVAYYNRGYAYECSKNFQQAIKDYKLASEIDPKFKGKYEKMLRLHKSGS